jgi:di/tricarboxylate transporter
MFKLLSVLAKTIPSIYYIVQLNIFVSETASNISDFWKTVFIYGVPSAIILSFLMYWFMWRDLIERQQSKEQDENESTMFTVKIQTLRMFRKYIPIAVVGMLLAVMFYNYKPYIISLSIDIGILYAWFLLGEALRIVDIGKKENKRIENKLKGS